MSKSIISYLATSYNFLCLAITTIGYYFNDFQHDFVAFKLFFRDLFGCLMHKRERGDKHERNQQKYVECEVFIHPIRFRLNGLKQVNNVSTSCKQNAVENGRNVGRVE